MKHFLSYLLVFFCIISCSDKNDLDAPKTFLIDNPLAKSISVTIDSKVYEMKPNSNQEIELAPGKHTLKSVFTGEVGFQVMRSGYKGALINPTLQPYISAFESYTRGPQERDGGYQGGYVKEIEIDGIIFEGKFKKSEKLFIVNDWNFKPGEPFPKVVETYDDKINTLIQNKIFRKMEFVDYIERMDKTVGSFAKSSVASVIPVVVEPDSGKVLPNFENQKLQASMKGIRVFVDDLIADKLPKDQVDWNKRYTDAIQAPYKDMTVLNKCSQADQDNFQKIILQFNEIVFQPVIIKSVKK